MPADNTNRLDDADIDRAHAISIGDIVRERGVALKRIGRELVGPCGGDLTSSLP